MTTRFFLHIYVACYSIDGLARLGHFFCERSSTFSNHQMPQTLLPSPEDKRNDAASFATLIFSKMGNNG